MQRAAQLLVLSAVVACTGCHDNFKSGEPGGSTGADPCDGVTCSGQGVCFANGDVAICVCADGFLADGIACVPETDEARDSGTTRDGGGQDASADAQPDVVLVDGGAGEDADARRDAIPGLPDADESGPPVGDDADVGVTDAGPSECAVNSGWGATCDLSTVSTCDDGSRCVTWVGRDPNIGFCSPVCETVAGCPDIAPALERCDARFPDAPETVYCVWDCAGGAACPCGMPCVELIGAGNVSYFVCSGA